HSNLMTFQLKLIVSENDIIFDYDSFIADKENNELIENNEFQEKDYNN
ncbi:15851_t:CDS:1, partial [Funneliformis caledonium]